MSLVLPKKRLVDNQYVVWRVGRGEEERGGGKDIPAVLELVAHVLEVVIAHVVDAKHEAVLVLRYALADVLE